jgi:hypothetical protein
MPAPGVKEPPSPWRGVCSRVPSSRPPDPRRQLSGRQHPRCNQPPAAVQASLLRPRRSPHRSHDSNQDETILGIGFRRRRG